MSRLLLAGAVAALAAMLAVGATFATRPQAPQGPRPLGPGEVSVHIKIRHSRFDVAPIRVVVGTTVRFVVENSDPINHELIVGDAAVHRRHESGKESVHPSQPGEVSVPALSTAETSFVFGQVGPVEYACHLPGHLRYGMVGFVEVLASR